MTALLAVAEQLTAAGLSVIPIGAVANKAPDSRLLPLDADGKAVWKPYQDHIALADELAAWFGPAKALGVVGGAVSGNLTILDFDLRDGKGLFDTFRAQVDALAPGLMDRLPIISTQSGGRHLYLRCTDCGGPQKLARSPSGEAWIETKAQGGYCLAPISAGYQAIQGTLLAIPEITPEERALLFAVARSFDALPPRAPAERDNLPGAGYNARASIDDMQQILAEAGWRHIGTRHDGTRLLCRPGKEQGISGTLGQGGHKSLYVFTSSAPPFEANRGYSPFAAYALLEHGGDYSAAASQLAREGYGGKPAPGIKPPEQPRYADPSTNGHRRAQEAEEPEPEAAVGIAFLTCAEIRQAPAISWLVDGIVPQNGLLSMVGESGSGKSFLAADLLLHIGSGRRWYDRDTQQGAGVYIVAEGQGGFGMRVDAWCNHYNAGRDVESVIFTRAAITPSDPRVVDVLLASLKRVGCPSPLLIVVDTLAATFVGDENLAADMSRFVNGLGTVRRETGAAVMVLHHFGWNGDRQRGSSALRAALDAELAVKFDKDMHVSTLSCTKMRDAPPFAPMSFQLTGPSPAAQVMVPAGWVAGFETTAQLSRGEAAILELLSTCTLDGSSTADLQAATGLPRTTFFRSLGDLAVAHHITASGEKRSAERRHFITEGGRHAWLSRRPRSGGVPQESHDVFDPSPTESHGVPSAFQEGVPRSPTESHGIDMEESHKSHTPIGVELGTPVALRKTGQAGANDDYEEISL